ncbi:MAG TPA: exodeoxyribonuclease VII large subunit [Firmicutes bacterium]|nr:exodeoxyribonuclease VII large subunit [Bacillota bacterium]
MQRLFSVSQITSYLRALLDGDEILTQVLVEGEISNFTHHSSGHMYFTLKDANSRLRCVMFRSRTVGLQFVPRDGMSVIAQGSISVYERDGQYQLYVNSLRPAGQGKLYIAFLELKEKLEREGLFAPENKLPLPFLPRTIGIATSPTGAALQDMLSIIGRRCPRVNVLVVPTIVQGAEAPVSIVNSIEQLGQIPEVDVVIVGRGGGSIEELWAFNDERVARAIFNCPKPVISAVGHETDFTIADFVADYRAATPSAAAETVVPVLAELELSLLTWQNRLVTTMQNNLLRQAQLANNLSARLMRQHPERRLENLAQALDGLQERLLRAMTGKLEWGASQIHTCAARLQALSPLAVLARGYTITLNQAGEVIRIPSQVSVGDMLETVVNQGRIYSQVISVGGRKDAATETNDGSPS